MIGAISRKIDKDCTVRLYLVGTYNSIDWNVERPSDLGDGFTLCDFKKTEDQKSGISITEGFDGNPVLRLTETKRYILKIEMSAGIDPILPRFQNEGNKFLKLDKDRDSVTFQFVNYLGRSRISFPGSDVVLSFEVVPDKIGYEDDYIKLTEAIADVCSELLLDYNGSTSNVYSQSENDGNTLLEQFIFLRKFCYSDNLQSLFEAIKRNPDRVLEQESELRPAGTGVPSRKFYQNPFSYSRGWTKAATMSDGTNVYVPQVIAVTRKYDCLDTLANRFIKYALSKFDTICTDLIEKLQTSEDGRQSECVAEARTIHAILEDIFRDRFFNEIGDLDIMPQNNQVLQKREGYSQIFSAYSMLDLALKLDWKGKNEIYEGESKNVALLYEYWLFFELYKIIKAIEGCKAVNTQGESFLMFDDGVIVSLTEGKTSCQSFEIARYGVKVNLYYNRTFSKSEFKTTRYEGSYSRPFRPDYTLAIFPDHCSKGRRNGEDEAISKGLVSYVHFDAKYRITDISSLIGNKETAVDDELMDDKTGAVVNTYKRGDLLKMHTYNDAIRRTIGSYVLYPGTYKKLGEGNETFSLYDEILPGVGAFSIKPSISALGEQELRSFIVSLLESQAAENTRLNRLKYYTEIVLNEPSSSTEQDVSDSNGAMKLGDTYVMGYIRGNSERDYYHFLKEKGYLSVGAEFLFYFYAIKGKNVYSHHKDIFRTEFFRFYKNNIDATGTYQLEPILCRIMSNELISRSELVEKLKGLGYDTDEERHQADFYYALRVRVEDDHYPSAELKISEVNRQNGNDTFSPHSPKVLENMVTYHVQDSSQDMNRGSNEDSGQGNI